MSDLDFFELVKERPDPTLDFWSDSCAVCGSTDIRDGGVARTLAGWAQPAGLSRREAVVHPQNPNHTSRHIHCNACGSDLAYEVKGGNVWYSERLGRVLAGIPSCFEPYTYTCRHCNGTVKRHYRTSDDRPARGLGHHNVDGQWIKNYYTVFRCEDCQAEVRSEQEYYRKESSHDQTQEDQIA